MAHKDRIFIYRMDGAHPHAPEPGFYAVRFGRGLPERALYIAIRARMFSAFVDGEHIAPDSNDWREAFGWIARVAPDFLAGRCIGVIEYKQIVTARQMERLADPESASKPIKINETKVAI